MYTLSGSDERSSGALARRCRSKTRDNRSSVKPRQIRHPQKKKKLINRHHMLHVWSRQTTNRSSGNSSHNLHTVKQKNAQSSRKTRGHKELSVSESWRLSIARTRRESERNNKGRAAHTPHCNQSTSKPSQLVYLCVCARL